MQRQTALAAISVFTLGIACTSMESSAQANSHVAECPLPSEALAPTLTDHLNGICLALSDRLDPFVSGDQPFLLITEHISPTLYRGHLAWREAGQHVRGPTVDVGFLDAPLSAAFYPFIVSSLINATDLPAGASGD